MRPMLQISKRYLLGGIGLIAIVLLPLSVRRDDLLWEAMQLAGYLSAIGCLFLIGAALRPRDARPSKLLTLEQHKWLAWISIALLVMHVGGVILVDRHTLEYLKPSMPVYQLAGILATLALIVLAITALGRIRQSLWRNASLFRAVHILLAALIVLFICVHVVATDRYTAGAGRWLWTGMTVLVLLLPLQRMLQATRPPRTLEVRRYGKQISFVLVLAAFACLGLAAQTSERRAQLTLETIASREQLLLVEFPHERHGTINCITCHHNFADQSGANNCIPCHRSDRTDLRLGAEARFHTFCMDCHRNGELPEGDAGRDGPVSRCSSCHRSLMLGTPE